MNIYLWSSKYSASWNVWNSNSTPWSLTGRLFYLEYTNWVGLCQEEVSSRGISSLTDLASSPSRRRSATTSTPTLIMVYIYQHPWKNVFIESKNNYSVTDLNNQKGVTDLFRMQFERARLAVARTDSIRSISLSTSSNPLYRRACSMPMHQSSGVNLSNLHTSVQPLHPGIAKSGFKLNQAHETKAREGCYCILLILYPFREHV